MWGVLLTVAMCLAGWVYQALVGWITFIFVKALITVGFAMLLAAMARLMLGQAKCRNRGVAILNAGLAALIAIGATHYYAYVWGTDEYAASAEVQAESPGMTGSNVRTSNGPWRYMQGRAEIGWQIDGDKSPITGFAVWAIWVIEAGIILVAVQAGASSLTGNPYCEACDNWADFRMLKLKVTNAEMGSIELICMATSLDDVLGIAKNYTANKDNTFVYAMTCCHQCSNAAHLTVKTETITRDSRGTENTKTTTLLNNIVLDAGNVEQVKMFAHRFNATVAAPVMNA